MGLQKPNYFFISEGEYSGYSVHGVLITTADLQTVKNALSTPLPYVDKNSEIFYDMDRPRSYYDLVEVLRVQGFHADFEWRESRSSEDPGNEINLDSDIPPDKRMFKHEERSKVDLSDPNLKEIFGRINSGDVSGDETLDIKTG